VAAAAALPTRNWRRLESIIVFSLTLRPIRCHGI